MNLNLQGKRALVCGSTQGIGRAAAVELALLGAEVTLLARNPERLAATRDQLDASHGQKHHWAAADFANVSSVSEAGRTLIESGRQFHILINNTGGPPGGTAIDAAPEAYLAAFNAHLLCNQILAQAVVPAMKQAKYGRIVNVLSTSVKAPIPNLGVSNTIRGAVASWAKTLAGELGPYGITVNNVLPGYTSTDRLGALATGRAQKAGTSKEQVEKEWLATIPAGRFGTPEELGAAIAFLCTPAAAYINGINLPVDGGRLQSL
ncbi:MAG TPA: SDR family oxidoreductase [Phycisphaerales bacterium]|nr:SDR family oxidoreductase [Phycisphaerales bacterium]